MSVVLVVSVTWVTLVVLVLGACVAAGRADRAAELDEVTASTTWVASPGFREPTAPATGVIAQRARRPGAIAAAPAAVAVPIASADPTLRS